MLTMLKMTFLLGASRQILWHKMCFQYSNLIQFTKFHFFLYINRTRYYESYSQIFTSKDSAHFHSFCWIFWYFNNIVDNANFAIFKNSRWRLLNTPEMSNWKHGIYEDIDRKYVEMKLITYFYLYYRGFSRIFQIETEIHRYQRLCCWGISQGNMICLKYAVKLKICSNMRTYLFNLLNHRENQGI